MPPLTFSFEKSLADLIRGIRATPDVDARLKYLQQAIAECRAEAADPDLDIKSQAVLKLAYLEMYGFDMSWAAFHVLEVMASPKFNQKRIGYLAALQSFRADSDLLVLATNLLKKDLNSSHHLEISVALAGVASFVTPALAHDLADDMLKMLNHSNPAIRKKAVLALYKILLQFPDALPSSFPRLRDKLTDPDPSVVSATVNVICELAKANPKPFIVFAPQLFHLLTSSTNNWMLIKILKLLASLVPMEPRLKQKILPQIINHIHSATAQSILYECINCIVSSGMLAHNDYDLADLCVQKLASFLESSDQNLKFVGLSALSKIVKIHPQFVLSNQDLILQCLDDPEITIRQRAIDMIPGMVSEDNIVQVTSQLVSQLNQTSPLPPTYRVLIINTILDYCAQNMYASVPDFDWYIALLVDLSMTNNTSNTTANTTTPRIATQLRDIAVRVIAVRDSVVPAALQLTLTQPSAPLLWLLGEYPSFLQNQPQTITDIINRLASESSPETLTAASQALAKIFAAHVSNYPLWSQARNSSVTEITNSLVEFYTRLAASQNYHVQERAAEFLELFKLVQDALRQHPSSSSSPPGLLAIALPALFGEYEINPVAPGSQLRIPTPPELEQDDSDWSDLENQQHDDWDVIGGSTARPPSPTKEWKSSVSAVTLQKRIDRLERQKLDPFYISTDDTPSTTPSNTPNTLNLEEIPIHRLEIAPSRLETTPSRRKVSILADEIVPGTEIPLPTKPKQKPSHSVQKLRNAFRASSALGAFEQEAVAPAVVEPVIVAKPKKKKKSKRKAKIEN